MKTIPKILRTFFTDTLETHQFAAVEFTLNQRLSTKVNCSCLDKAQNLPVEKIINTDFFPLEFVNGGKALWMHKSVHWLINQFLLIRKTFQWFPTQGPSHYYRSENAIMH